MSEKLKNTSFRIKDIVANRRPDLSKSNNIEAPRDMQKVQNFKQLKNLEFNSDISQAELLEYAIYDQIYRKDWLGHFSGDDDIVDDEQFGLFSFMPSEYDDYFNHSDIICLVNNNMTGGETIPFILDVTYNESSSGLESKFTHSRHNTDVIGSARIKYFQNRDHRSLGEELGINEGEILCAPRFIVGADNESADEIIRCTNKIDRGVSLAKQEVQVYDKDSLLMRLKVVNQLSTQAKFMQDYFSGRLEQADYRSNLTHKVLLESKHQIDILKPFFERAVREAKAEFTASYGELPNIQLDSVVRSIENMADLIYTVRTPATKKALGAKALHGVKVSNK